MHAPSWCPPRRLPPLFPLRSNNPSFSDWSDFGGWTRPSIKQYQGDITKCGAGVDVNWYP